MTTVATMPLGKKVSFNINELLNDVTQLNTREIERIVSELSMILARRKAPSLPEQESILLQKIGEGLPDVIQNRYETLQKKLLAEEVAPDEHYELLELIEITEQADADRLSALIQLSQLRQVSLDTLMSQLGLQQPPVYV